MAPLAQARRMALVLATENADVRVLDANAFPGVHRSVPSVRSSWRHLGDMLREFGWPRAALYHDPLAEPISQAIAAEVFKQAAQAAWDRLAHVHCDKKSDGWLL